MTAPQAPAKASFFEDFIEIFTSPAQVFQRRMGSNFFMMFAIVAVIAIALIMLSRGVFQPAMDAEWQRASARAMAANPQVTAAQMEQARGFMDKFGMVIFAVSVVIAMLCGGLVLWLVGKMFGAQQSAGDAMMVAMYAWIPRVIGLIAVLVIAMLMDPAKMNSYFSPSVSLARFLDPDTTSQKMMTLAGRVDVFVIWQTILLGIGLSVTGKIDRTKAFVAAGIVWLIGTAILAGTAR